MILVASLLALQAVQPLQPVPAPRQLSWHEREAYAFVHFGPNTFTGVEWGDGKEAASVFAPTALDCEQWAQTFRDAGLSGVIITAKHHDGFCLWPTKYSEHSVSAENDVLKMLSEACAAHGLDFGVYLSPWDRNHPAYGTAAYNEVFKNMLREVLTQYGDVFEVWFDGANGEGANGKRQEYDWDKFIEVVRKHQPGAVIFSDAGPDVRWIGNERGYADTTNWAKLNRDEFLPGTPRLLGLLHGQPLGRDWVPAEADVSIRPGWFWRASENERVKSPEELVEIWHQSVGRNANLLLNVPPDARGLIAEPDRTALAGMRERLSAIYDTGAFSITFLDASSELSEEFRAQNAGNGAADAHWSPGEEDEMPWLRISTGMAEWVDRVLIREAVTFGQRVREFEIQIDTPDGPETVAEGFTIGNRRILRFDAVKTNGVRLVVKDSYGQPVIRELKPYFGGPQFEAYPQPCKFYGEFFVALNATEGAEVRYTTNGDEPTLALEDASSIVSLSESTNLKARAWLAGKATTVQELSYQKLAEKDLIQAVQFIRAPDDGLQQTVFTGAVSSVDDIAQLKEVSTTIVETIDTDGKPGSEPYAIRWSGFLAVPEDGAYAFFMASDGGSRLRIANQTVVDLDGDHDWQERIGSIGLRAGHHPFELVFFDPDGWGSIALLWGTNGRASHGMLSGDALSH